MRINEESPELNEGIRQDWERCGLRATPLENVTYFYPYSENDCKAQTKLDKETVEKNVREKCGFRYFYNVRDAIDQIRLLVEDIDDPNHTLVSCAEYCSANIPEDSTWNTFRATVGQWSERGKTPDQKIPVVSWRRFNRIVGQRTRNPLFTERSVTSEQLRQVPLREMVRELERGQIVVVDIAQLPDYLQSFVVGDVIDLIRTSKSGEVSVDDEEEERQVELGTVVLFADELNKFAPKQGGNRGITHHLREISERGRSEGIILLGAEQFRTKVDEQVTGNSSTQVFGRTTPVEAGKDPEIRGLPGSQTRVPFLKKGELMVSHTRFSSGALKLRFPKNAYNAE